MLKIYGRFPVFILSVLFNDADKLFKLRQTRFFFSLEFLVAVSVKNVRQCDLIGSSQSFGGICRINLQGRTLPTDTALYQRRLWWGFIVT
jgi:hypothetical protein